MDNKSMISPFIEAYSNSLIEFISFIRENFPVVTGNGTIGNMDELEDISKPQS